ncbi:GNAT family N-acetyltransferase [Undibacterium arcticum]|uniref:GNAT family N-acetyltransferase n=1 Tax=Undibacterium arcticum TaxID=1762892 RepID=A0ABV7F1N2_9BURK
MNLQIKTANPNDALVVASLVMDLTTEICFRCNDQKQFHRDTALTSDLCALWISDNCYTALIAYAHEKPIGVATIAESYALYAGGKIGIIQEFYVAPDHREQGVGNKLIDVALSLAAERDWACMELCTPPLPEFKQTIDFYQKYDFISVGGRKMRRQCKPA